MVITPEAQQFILEHSKQQPPTIRVLSSGMGWGGPDLYVTLDESEYKDSTVTVEGILVSIQPGILPYVEENQIDLVETEIDKRLIIIDPDLMR